GESLTTESPQTAEPQSLIQQQPLDSVGESSTTESSQSESPTIESQSLIQQQPLDSVEESPTIESPSVEPQSLIQQQPFDSVGESLTTESPQTAEPQSLIQQQPLDSVGESSTIESPQISPEIPNPSSSPTGESQSLKSVGESSTTESPQISPEIPNPSSYPTIEPESFIQQPLNSVGESSTTESPQLSPEIPNPSSSPTGESQSFIQEQPLDSIGESPTIESPQPSTIAIIPSTETQSNMIQQQAKNTEDLSSTQSNVTNAVNQQQTDNQLVNIQPSVNPENLTNLNIIPFNSPLSQQSDFIQSRLINEFIESPQDSQPSPKITPVQPSQTPETWSSQFDLMSESIPVTENEPESWSDITEMMNYDNSNPSFNSESTPDTSKSITRDQKPSIPDNSALVSSSQTKAETVIGEQEEQVFIDQEQLEILARKVYSLLRKKLEIERESHNFKTDASLPWLDTISSINPGKVSMFSSRSSPVGQLKTQTGSTVSLVNYKLQRLTRTIEQLLQSKIETERERLGSYYIGNLPW
ncbi:MAG: hypothetical protein AAFO04_28670, partial [Cyanobacteria bacterium J06592_8]